MAPRLDHVTACAFDSAAVAAGRHAATVRQVTKAMNCALMSDCQARQQCVAKVFQLLDGVAEDGRWQGERAA